MGGGAGGSMRLRLSKLKGQLRVVVRQCLQIAQLSVERGHNLA